MDDIDKKITMLYNYVYSKSFKEDIEEFEIDESNIDLTDIKIELGSDDYNDILADLLKGRFSKFDYNESTNTIVLKKYGEGLSYSIYISPYVNDNSITEMDNSNNNDCLFSYILSKLVLSKKTKHISLPIINVDAEFSQIHDILDGYKDIFEHYQKQIDNEEISNVFSLRARESFFKSVTLTQFLEKNDFNIKHLLFQICHTLAVLQNNYKGFRHNNLNLDSIYVYLKKPSIDIYEFNGDTFYLSNNNFDIKISNFGSANIPSLFGGESNIPFYDKNNDYFDLHYFLNNLLLIISDLDEETINFLENIIPSKYRTADGSYMNKYVELFKPSELLLDDYFKEFLKKVDKEQSMLDNEYYTNKNKKIIDSYKGSRKIKESTIDKPRIERRLSKSSHFVEQVGAGGVMSQSAPKVANNPYMTNEQRRIIKNEEVEPKIYVDPHKQDSPEPVVTPKKEKQLLMKKETYINPSYIKPYNPRERPSWDNDYIPPPPITKVPMAKATYDNDTNRISDEERTVPMAKVTYQNDDSDNKFRREIRSENKFNRKDKELIEETDTDSSEIDQEKYIKEMFQEKQPYKKDYNRDYRESNYNRDNRDNSDLNYNRDNRPYKTQYQKNISDYPIISEHHTYQNPQTMFPRGTLHTHPKYGNPAWVSIDNQMSYPSPFVNNFLPLGPYHGMALAEPNKIPLQKIYNINLGQPGSNNSLLNTIYQDTLPGNPYVYTMVNLFQRKHLINSLRGSMIKEIDGEEMSIQPGESSFLEYIRLMEFNPYALGENPYSKLPINFLLYNGSYPIRYNVDKQKLDIAKNAMSVNIRIYALSKVALLASQVKGSVSNQNNFDVWRDILYYNYIREEIQRNKISPNFIGLILFKIDPKSNINYKELESIIKSHTSKTDVERQIRSNQKTRQLLNLNTSLTHLFLGGQVIDINKVNDADYSGKSLVALTEAPTCNLISWFSPSYEISGAIRTEISTGFHTPEVWRSVLFQMAYAMAVLQEKNIYIKNFSVENNIFIKDLFSDSNNIGHWVYTVNDIDMYIPNYGYLVTIDTRYVDDTTIPTSLPSLLGTTSTSASINYKIESSELYGDIDHKNDILNDFKKVFNKTDYSDTGAFKKYGIIKPDDEILNLIDKINISKELKIKDIIIECFPEYFHNRVGTLLTKSERDALSLTTMPKLVPGSLVAYQSRFDEYRWAIFKENHNTSKNKKIIIIKDDNGKFNYKEVFSHSLIDHPESNNINQTSEKNFRLNKDSFIEAYKL